MAATAKKPAQPKFRIVGEPDLAQLEKVVTEAAKQTAPIVQRTSSVRDELVVKVKALDSERSDLVDRKTLLTRQYEAAVAGLDMHIADVDAARALYVGGLGGEKAAVTA
jgi:hypothetical protein